MSFEKATKLKLRYETGRGRVTTEDLWDMPLTGSFSLDELAQSLHKAVKSSEEKSFVVKKTKANEILQLQFDIVKYIIDVKLEEQKQAKNSAANKLQKEKILGIIADKEDDSLAEMSVKDLKKMAKNLK